MSGNSTSYNATESIYADDPHWTFWLVVWITMMLLFVIGVAANIVILVVVKRTPSMHSVTNILLCNLAVLDLAALLWPLLIVGVFHLIKFSSRWPAFHIFCKFSFAFPNILFACSVLTLCLIAVERYQALVNTVVSKLKLTSKNVKYFILAFWITGLISALPDFLFLSLVELRNGQIICGFAEGSIGLVKNFVITYVVLIIFVPMNVICFCYFKIVYGVHVSKTILSRSSAGNEETRLGRNIVKISILVTVAFVLCCGPDGVITVLFHLELLSEEFFENRVLVVVYLLGFIKPIINPFLYAFQRTDYSAAVKSMFRSCCCNKVKRKRISPKLEKGKLSA